MIVSWPKWLYFSWYHWINNSVNLHFVCRTTGNLQALFNSGDLARRLLIRMIPSWSRNGFSLNSLLVVGIFVVLFSPSYFELTFDRILNSSAKWSDCIFLHQNSSASCFSWLQISNVWILVLWNLFTARIVQTVAEISLSHLLKRCYFDSFRSIFVCNGSP